MLYREKRQNIIMESEVSARESADHLDKYLSTNIDSVNLAAYTLDEMIRENKTDREIQDYLVAQSTAIKSAVFDLSADAIAANEAKSAFLSNMSHEIRTPINAILGMNEMMGSDLEVKRQGSWKNILRMVTKTVTLSKYMP